MEDRGNCFIMLQLDPDIDDENVIKKEILKKQADWSRDYNISPDPEIKRTAQKCLANLDSIKKILLDPQSRKDEALKAKKIINNLRDSKRVEE